MRLLRDWFRPKDQISPVSFLHKHVNMKLQTSMQSTSVSIFCIGLLRLSAVPTKPLPPQLLIQSVIWNDFDL